MKKLAALIAVCAFLCGACTRPTSSTAADPVASVMTVPETTVLPSATQPLSSAPATTAAPPTSPAPTVPPTFEASTEEPDPPQTEPDEPARLLDDGERAELDGLIASFDGSVSVGWLDLTSGEEYLYSGDAVYCPASLVKAPFGLWLLTLCDSGELDLDEELTLGQGQIREGTGVIKNDPPGTVYTVRELISLMMTVSDNTAFKMLRDRAGLSAYNRFCRDVLGVSRTTYLELTAADCLKILSAIYDYIFPDGFSAAEPEDIPDKAEAPETPDNRAFLRELMRSAVYRIIKAPGQEILHKHGWANPVYHDMAIVLCERPYAIVILSDHCGGTAEDVKMFADISRAVFDFHSSPCE